MLVCNCIHTCIYSIAYALGGKYREQGEHEPVQAYVDEISMLLSQLAIPEAIKVDLMLQNMTHWLKTQVIQTIPRSLEDLINSAIFIQDKISRARTFDKANSWQPPQSNDQRDPLDHFSRAAKEWSTAANSWMDQVNTADYGGLHSPELDRPRQRQSCFTCNRSSKHCKCKKDTCRAAERLWTDPYKHVPRQLLESQACNVQLDFEPSDCKPSTPEALEYAKRWADSHEQHAQHRSKHEAATSGSGAALTAADFTTAANTAESVKQPANQVLECNHRDAGMKAEQQVQVVPTVAHRKDIVCTTPLQVAIDLKIPESHPVVHPDTRERQKQEEAVIRRQQNTPLRFTSLSASQ